VLDPEKHDLSSKGHLTKNFCYCFWCFYVKTTKKEQTPGVLSLKIKFSSKIDQPYYAMHGIPAEQKYVLYLNTLGPQVSQRKELPAGSVATFKITLDCFFSFLNVPHF
jgi:hypothetical protein